MFDTSRQLFFRFMYLLTKQKKIDAKKTSFKILDYDYFFVIKIIYDKSGELEQLPTFNFESFTSIFQQNSWMRPCWARVLKFLL